MCAVLPADGGRGVRSRLQPAGRALRQPVGVRDHTALERAGSPGPSRSFKTLPPTPSLTLTLTPIPTLTLTPTPTLTLTQAVDPNRSFNPDGEVVEGRSFNPEAATEVGSALIEPEP